MRREDCRPPGLWRLLAAEFSDLSRAAESDGYAVFGVVGVGGQNVHRVSFEQPLGDARSFLSPASSHRRSGHLHRATLIHPLQDSSLRLLQNRIALGMSDHGRDANVGHPGEAFVDLCRNAVVAQFDQQVVAVFDGVAFRRNQDFLQVVVRKMEIAAQAQPRSSARPIP